MAEESIKASEPHARSRWRFPAIERWGLDSNQSAILAAIVLGTIAVYLRCLSNTWIYDDFFEIVNNPYLEHWSFVWNSFRYDSWWFRGPEHLPQDVYYRPLQNTWLAVNYWLFGLHPAGWHISQILLHALGVVLVFRMAQLITRNAVTALVAAALFGVVAAHVEPIVWISSIPEPLAATFMFASFCAYAGRKRLDSAVAPLAYVLYACALLSHESAILFVLIIGAYAYLFETACETGPDLARRPLRTRLRIAGVRMLPFLALAAAYMGARVFILGVRGAFGLPKIKSATIFSLAHPQPEKIVHVYSHPITEQLMTAPAVLVEYFKMLLLPWYVGPTHPTLWVRHPSLALYVPLAVLIVLAVAAIHLVRRSREPRIYTFSAIWFGLALAPALNFNQIVTLVQDRYLYTPTFGWCLALAAATVEIAVLWPRARRVLAVAIAMLLVTNAVAAFHAEGYWHDEIEYNRIAAKFRPTNMSYTVKLAMLYAKQGKIDEGVKAWREAIPKLSPSDQPLAHTLFYQFLMMNGRRAEALQESAKGHLHYRPAFTWYGDVLKKNQERLQSLEAERNAREAQAQAPNSGGSPGSAPTPPAVPPSGSPPAAK